MNLSTILKEMETNRPAAQADITLGNPSTQRAREGLKRSAVDTLRRLTEDYRNTLRDSALFIVVTGSASQQFAELASQAEFGCFPVDPDNFYRDLCDKISPAAVKPSLYSRENAKNLFNVAQNVLYDVAKSLDVESYDPLFFNDKYNVGVKTAEEFLPVLRSAINEQVGVELSGLSAIYSIVDSAIEKKYAAPITPIILGTSDEKFALDLKNGLKKRKLANGTNAGLVNNVFLVIAGKSSKELTKTQGAVSIKTVTQESVGEVLANIRNKVL